MRAYLKLLFGAAVLGATALPAVVQAQETASDLLALDVSSLRGEMQQRYSAALTVTLDPGVVSTDNNRFMWASQAKAQCGIAIAFLKSGTKDPVSVGKCVDAFNRMQGQAAPAYLPPPPPPPTPCNPGPYIVFFDWDRSDITLDASTVLDNMVAGYAGCSQRPIIVSGYTDRSGSDRYNQGLSERRAEAVREYLVSRGLSGTSMTTQGFGETNPRVPTADGVRELQNRRVELVVE